MNLKFLTDTQLIKDLKDFSNKERTLLTQILYHLKELDSRKLYSSLGYKSLYDYACKELQYSADQAYRRIQAMRLLKELPEISTQINSGSLSLSNISQAQRYFNESKTINKNEKIQVLKQLENKSVRDAQKQLLSLSPEKPLPTETKKQITPTQTHVNFIMSEELENKLESVRSLMGPKGTSMSLAELVASMAELSIEKLKEKKFGKKRIVQEACTTPGNLDVKKSGLDVAQKTIQLKNTEYVVNGFDQQVGQVMRNHKKHENQSPLKITVKNSRYLPAELKHKIWCRDQGQCIKCSSKQNLNFDHIKPWALGGKTSEENLRLLCFHCNQRQRLEAKL